MSDCIFCNIVSKEIPKDILYEDEMSLAFLDIAPVRAGHTLVIPKKHTETFLETDQETLKAVITATQKVAQAVVGGMRAEGCNVSTNNGRAGGQVVFHLHWHIIPRVAGDGLVLWPQQKYVEDEEVSTFQKIKRLLN